MPTKFTLRGFCGSAIALGLVALNCSADEPESEASCPTDVDICCCKWGDIVASAVCDDGRWVCPATFGTYSGAQCTSCLGPCWLCTSHQPAAPRNSDALPDGNTDADSALDANADSDANNN